MVNFSDDLEIEFRVPEMGQLLVVSALARNLESTEGLPLRRTRSAPLNRHDNLSSFDDHSDEDDSDDELFHYSYAQVNSDDRVNKPTKSKQGKIHKHDQNHFILHPKHVDQRVDYPGGGDTRQEAGKAYRPFRRLQLWEDNKGYPDSRGNPRATHRYSGPPVTNYHQTQSRSGVNQRFNTNYQYPSDERYNYPPQPKTMTGYNYQANDRPYPPTQAKSASYVRSNGFDMLGPYPPSNCRQYITSWDSTEGSDETDADVRRATRGLNIPYEDVYSAYPVDDIYRPCNLLQRNRDGPALKPPSQRMKLQLE